MKAGKKWTAALPILAGAMWGSAGVFVRKLYAFGMDSYTILASKMCVGAVILFLILLCWKPKLLRVRWQDLWIFLGSGILGMLGLNYCYNEAIRTVSMSLAAVLLGLSPVFVMLLSAVLFRERITARKLGCMALALVGCLLVSGVLEGSGLQWSWGGIGMGVLSAFFYALYAIFSKTASNRGYDTFTIIFYSILAISLVLLPLTDWGSFGAFLAEAPVGNTVFTLAHAAFTTILPYALYTLSQLYLDGGMVAILASGGEPTAACVFGALFFQEYPSVWNLLGLAVTVAALTLLCRPERKR